MDRINNCDTLLKRNEIEKILKRIVIGDEMWIKYDKHGEDQQNFRIGRINVSED